MTLLNSPKTLPLYFRSSYGLGFRDGRKGGEMLGWWFAPGFYFLFFFSFPLLKRLFKRIYLSRIFNKELQKPWRNVRA